jgi:hypothetical protein
MLGFCPKQKHKMQARRLPKKRKNQEEERESFRRLKGLRMLAERFLQP